MNIEKTAGFGVLMIFAAASLFGQAQDAEKIAKALEERLAGHLKFEKNDKADAAEEVNVTMRDQVTFNPQRLQLRKIKGEWKIVEGDHWIFGFGSNKQEAEEALKIIRFYGMNRVGYMGRPDPSFTYLLCPGTTPNRWKNFPGIAPSGRFPGGEDCLAFDPERATVKEFNGRWKIVDGGKWLYDFGRKKAEALASLFLIKVYGFNRACTIVRGKNRHFTYLRR